MALTTEQKTCLLSKKDAIKVSFDTYKHVKPYMGVYFDSQERPYITFSNSDDFVRPSFKLTGQVKTYFCTYDCAADFDTQTTTFTT